jgi:acyl dehydratase
MSTTIAPGELGRLVDTELGISDWFEVTQSRIDAFADATNDHQFVHVDVARARETPFGGTIAHGLLTLSLIVPLCIDFVPKLTGTRILLNYGFNRVRFPTYVRSGKRIRARAVLTAVDARSATEYLLTIGVTIEVEGETKPALVAEWLNYHVIAA